MARAVKGGLAPALPPPVDVPLALHLEMRVQGVLADPVEQVLAARDNAVHHPTAQVDGRRLRHAQLEAGHLGARQHLVQAARRPEDRVTLGQGPVPGLRGSATSRSSPL